MFSRYSLCASGDEISARFHVDVPPGYKPSFNAAPSQLLPVITQDSQKGLSFFYWGTSPDWAKNKPLGERIINSRAEYFFEKQVLKKRLRERRCLVPADGFYGWKKTGKKTAIPYRFTRKDKALFAMAGIWEEYDEAGDTFHTFSVITASADERHPPYDERRPVILNPESESMWLNADDESKLLDLVATGPADVDFYPVASLVNFPEINDRRVIMPSQAADQFGNLSLFD